MFIEGYEMTQAVDILNPKKKIWDRLQLEFSVDNELNVVYKDMHQLRTTQGAVTCHSLKGAAVR